VKYSCLDPWFGFWETFYMRKPNRKSSSAMTLEEAIDLPSIALSYGVTDSAVRKWTQHPDFPDPVDDAPGLARPVWDANLVYWWTETHRRVGRPRSA
jgi:hypothetical protein